MKGPTGIHGNTRPDLGEQLVPCSHADCLSLAELISGVLHADGEFEVIFTCVTHVPWAIEQLLEQVTRDPGARLLTMQLHAGTEAGST